MTLLDATERNDFGTRLREWRERRRHSQLGLAVEAEVSQRHLSFLESGRSRPSREMVLRLCETLSLPLRERNALLGAAGFAPHYPQTDLDAPAMAGLRRTIGRLLDAQMPHPALAVDRHWRLQAANAAVGMLLEGVAPDLLAPPVDVLRLSLHPAGLAGRIVNLPEWRGHILRRLTREADQSGDPVLARMARDLAAIPVPPAPAPRGGADPADRLAVPLRLRSPAGVLSFLSTTTVFGTAIDVTLADLTVETFLPADPETAQAMARLAEQRAGV